MLVVLICLDRPINETLVHASVIYEVLIVTFLIL